MTSTIAPTRPEWGDAKAVSRHFGLSRSTLYRLAGDGKIRTSSLRERGRSRGKRLFSMDSVADYIDSHASGGEGAEPDQFTQNQTRDSGDSGI